MDGVERTDLVITETSTIDRRPVMGIRLGRGRTGGSTFADTLIQRARAAGRKVVIADGDLRNSTLSTLYPPGSEGGTLRPQSDDMVDMKDLFTTAVAKAVEQNASLMVDFGGGDRVMLEYERELSLAEMAESLGLEPLAIYVTGPEPEDFDHIVSLWRSEAFRPEHSLLILNEHLVPNGRSPAGAFRNLVNRVEWAEMAEGGLQAIIMPRLPCMTQMREAGLSLIDALKGRSGKNGARLDPVRQFMVKTWLKRLETIFTEADVVDWLP